MSKPVALPVLFDNIPDELRTRPQWVLWRYVYTKSKWTKPPLTPSGTNASTTDPNTWSSFDIIVKAYQTNQFDGIGYVFNDDYIGADQDKNISLETFTNLHTYTERSPSGNGLHAILRGKLNGAGTKTPNIEIYSKGRYFTFTGHIVPADKPQPIANVNGFLEHLYQTSKEKPTNGTLPQVSIPNPKLELALQRVNELIAYDHRFSKIWLGTAKYPSDSELAYGLLKDLLRVTLLDTGLAFDLFRRSPVYQIKPDKWERTVLKYDANSALDNLVAELKATPTQPTNQTWLSLDQLFALPEPEYLLDYRIVKGGINAIVGDTANGKTFWLIDATMRIATTGGLNVLYVAAENVQGVALRAKAWCQHHKVKPNSFMVWPKAVNLMNGDTDKFIQAIASLHIDVIVYDTFSMCIPGAKENSPEDMTLAVAALTRIQQAKECTTLLGHHTTKDGIKERGHSSFKAALDHMLIITKVGNTLTLEYNKTRQLENPRDEQYKLIPVTIDGAFYKDGKPIVSAVIELLHPTVLQLELTTDGVKLLLQLSTNPMNYTELREVLRWHNRRLTNTLALLINRNLIAKEGRKAPYSITASGLLCAEKYKVG